MVKLPFHIMPQSTACLLAAALISTVLLCGCSGGGKDAKSTPLASVTITNGLLKLGAVGTTTDLIAGMDLQVNLPAGVTVDADPGSGEAATGAVTISGAAAAGSNSMVVAKFAPAAAGAPAMLHIVVLNTAGLHPGEFVTVRFNLAAGASFPALNAFTIASFSAKGLDSSTLSGITGAVLSVEAAGNAASTKQAQLVVISPDQSSLNISIDTPTRNSSQIITGTLFPGDDLTISTDTGAIVNAKTITGGAWRAQVSELVEGDNIIAVTETDSTGNYVASVSATISRDIQPPSLSVAAAVYGTKSSFTSIGGTVDDNYKYVTIAVSCSTTAIVERPLVAIPIWSANVSNLSYGDNQCTVTATDGAGNSISKDVLIHYDNIVPDLNILPVNDLVKHGTVQTISGTVDSGIKPVMIVNGGAYAGAMTFDGINWSCQVDGLAEGANIITVTATDAAGNVATRTATITTVTAKGSFSGLSQPGVADALKALRIAVGFDQPTAAELLYGDLFDDGKIDLADAILILEKAVGL
jgi:large repetitive protein